MLVYISAHTILKLTLKKGIIITGVTRGSAARFSERYPLLITETYGHTHFYDEFWRKATPFGYFLPISG